MDVAVVNIRLSLLDSALCVYSDCSFASFTHVADTLFHCILCFKKIQRSNIGES